MMNLAALGLLVFALYLNFVRKESNDVNLRSVPAKNATSSLSHEGLKGNAAAHSNLSFSMK
jgi:hypothetical protein